MNIIAKNIVDINNRILKSANGREVTFVAVTKTFGADKVEQAIKAGMADIAESKVQEALPKFEVLSNSFNGINKHFIGHLQSNKVKKAVLNFDLIQSLDSVDLANDINKYANSVNKIQKCLIELKVSQEETKYGVSVEKLYEIYDYCFSNCKNVLICGIMTIAPYFDNKEEVRPYFKMAYNVYLNMQKKVNSNDFKILSMGMSGDFEIAIEEGSNMVRVGSAVFGERNYDK